MTRQQTLPERAQPAWLTALSMLGATIVTLLVNALTGTDGFLLANTFLTSSIITKEAMRILTNNLVFGRTVNRTYDGRIGKAGAKIGDSFQIRKPPRYLGRTGSAMQVEAIEETSVTARIEEIFGVDTEISDYDLAMSLDNFSEKVIKPAVARIANRIDQKLLEKAALSIPYQVGTPGSIPNALLTYALAATKLDDNSAPQDGRRYMTISSLMQAYIVDAAKALFHASAEISAQYRKGEMGMFAGFTFQMDQNVYTHTVGPLGGTPLVNGASQTGTSLITDGWTAAAANRVKRGDRFTVASVNHLNPASYMSTGQGQQFVITADGDSDSSGNLTLSISPSILASGARATVDALAANNAALTMVGAANTQTPVGIAHHRDAVGLLTADLDVPDGTDRASRVSDPDMGLSIRFVRDFEMRSGLWLSRFDVAYGTVDLRCDSLACAVNS